MTNRRPFMPLDVDDYEADTRHLKPEEDGVYGRLLRAMWSAGGQLPDSDARLAQIARISIKRWNGMAATIRAFFMVVNGHLEQKRINAELGKISDLSAKRQAAGKQGGRPAAPKHDAEKEGDVALPKGSRKAEKPLENGHDQKQKVSTEGAFAFSEQQQPLFPQESFPPNPPSKNTPISPSVSVARARKAKAKPKVSKKTHVLVRDVLETRLSADMAQAVIQHRNVTIKKPLTELAAQQLVEEFGKADEAGITPDDAARLMIRKGWRGFEADWAIPRQAMVPGARAPPAVGSPPAPDADENSEENLRAIAAKLEAKYARK